MKITLDAFCITCQRAIPSTENTRVKTSLGNAHKCAGCRRTQPTREELIERLLERRDRLREEAARAEARLAQLRGGSA